MRGSINEVTDLKERVGLNNFVTTLYKPLYTIKKHDEGREVKNYETSFKDDPSAAFGNKLKFFFTKEQKLSVVNFFYIR